MRRMTIALLAAGLMLCAVAAALTLDETLEKMNARAQSIKDVETTAKVTRFDAILEEESLHTVRLYWQRPYLARFDTLRMKGNTEVITHQVIVGKDFVLRVWPETRTAERTWIPPEKIQDMMTGRNDPISLFGRSADEIKKDFLLEQMEAPDQPEGTVNLRIIPARPDVKADFTKVEMVMDTRTWLPRSLKSYLDDDWTEYVFMEVKLNPGLPARTFEPPPGINIKDVKGDE